MRQAANPYRNQSNIKYIMLRNFTHNLAQESRLSMASLWLCALLIAAGCSNGKGDESGTDADLPVFEMVEFSRAIDSCDEAKNYCVKMSAVYPVLKSGVPRKVVAAVNDSVLQYVKSNLTTLETGTNLRELSLQNLSDSLFQSYRSYAQESEYISPWELELTGEVLYLSKKFVTVAIENYGFTGGAHPYSNTTLLNFDLKTGKPVQVLGLIRDKKALMALAEKAFRKSRELSPDENLNQAGFFWDATFQLPANLGIAQDGLYFYYNAYEIAAYAWGPTDFVISWEELGDLLDRGKME